ncbi:hypothetical protein O3P69_006912 [Scylla paramamosain]|uniref:Uncharacterized protein n=1 Tax=Scylla paramamosain TaxID=85552 RepID=A0AAW0U329_SCYPA
MYRKYIQELSASSSSPDPDFPDTNLIVGEAQLKAAKAGAAHLDQHLQVAPAMPASPSSPGLSDTRNAHTTVGDPPPPRPASDSDTEDDASSVALSVRSESTLASVGQTTGGVARSASSVCRGRSRLKESRRHSEIFHLQEIFSRSNTPEFRRRPTAHARPSLHSSPPRVSEDDRFSTLSQDEVIVVRPVAEASCARSPLYPAPRGDLLLNHRSDTTPGRGVIKVLSASSASNEAQEAAGPRLTKGAVGAVPSSSHHLNNTLGRDSDPWLRSARRLAASPPQNARRHSAGPSLYSMFCCRAFTSGR